MQRFQLPGCYYRESDFCYLDDMTGASQHPLARAFAKDVQRASISTFRQYLNATLVIPAHPRDVYGARYTKRIVSVYRRLPSQEANLLPNHWMPQKDLHIPEVGLKTAINA